MTPARPGQSSVLGSSLSERADEQRRDQQDEFKDPWGYDEPTYNDYLRENTE